MVKGDACSFYLYIVIRILPNHAWVRGILRDFIPPRLFYMYQVYMLNFFFSAVQNQMSEEIINNNTLAPFARINDNAAAAPYVFRFLYVVSYDAC